MNLQLLRMFLQHRNRKWIVPGVSLALLLAVGLPLIDQWKSTRQMTVELEESIHAVSLRLESLPELREQAKTRQVGAQLFQGIDQKQLPEYRDRVLGIVRSCQCRLLSSTEGKGTRQPWSTELNPFEEGSLLQNAKDKKNTHELISSSLTFLVEGEMTQIIDLLAKLKELDEYAVPAKLSVQSTGNGKQLKLELEMRFFKLAKLAG